MKHTFTDVLHPCLVCESTLKYCKGLKCVNCNKPEKKTVVDKGKYYFNKLITQTTQEPVYNPRRRFDIDQLRTPEFRLSERVVMAGVDYR